jgi:hypothetical protein
MYQNILTQSTVFEFAFSVYNSQDNDTQTLIAAFSSFPSPQDWQHWLSGWIECGYSLFSEPILIRTIQ